MNKIKEIIFDFFYEIGSNPKPFIAGAISSAIGGILGAIAAHAK